jgi:secreted protein with Ig-like and vWFA domain
MVGGKFSFGSGGYFGSAIDELLPVSMELRTEHRKLAVAMAVVMDRSGSMAASVAGGVTKMDLANEGVARAIELLGPNDAVSVLAVDSEPHIVVPLTKLGKNREDIDDRVRRITSGGGGIYVYVGLKAAWEELKKSDAGSVTWCFSPMLPTRRSPVNTRR